MNFRSLVAALVVLLAATPALSAPPVVTDILPIQSLVARVMEGVGTPQSIVPPGASPHSYSMRPSQARALAQAEVVFRVGEALAPWFEKAIEGLAEDAVTVELMTAPGVAVLDFPERGHAGEHAEHEEGHADEHDEHEEGHADRHDEHEEGHAGEHAEHEEGHADEHDEHGEGHADGHAKHEEGHADEHDEHDEHGEGHADEHAEHEEGHADGHEDEHEDEHVDGHDHAHEGADPHIWLDPVNGRAILAAVADVLSRIDPENAAAYTANAAAGAADLDALTTRANAILAPVRGKAFVTAHDAYQYFEHRFGIESAGAVATVDAEAPGPARLARIREIIREENIVCIFIEPQLDDKLIRAAAEGSEARIAVLDPNGGRLAPGPDLYPNLIEGLAQDLADCLAGSG